MTSSPPPRRDPPSVLEPLDEFLLELHEGRTPDLEEWITRHPEVAEELRVAQGDWEVAARALARAPSSSRSEPLKQHAAGDTIGDYRLIKLLGRGGQGAVWEAEQESLARRVALKLIRPDRVTEHSLSLLQREARAGGRLAHPGIVAVHAWGASDGIHWIAQELVPGGRTLFDWIEAQRKRPSLAEGHYERVATWVAQLCDSIGTAHSAGVIHRDVKPLNVLLTERDEPKLTDFGLARVSEDSELSVSGDVLGTYCYMSPEQIEASRSQVDARTDIFSLGVVMYELLSLRRPFEGDTSHQIAFKILHEEAPNLRELRSRMPEDLAVICGKAMEKERSMRYASMSAFAEDLRRWLAHEPILAKPPSPWRRARKWTLRHPTWTVALGVAAVGSIAVSVLLVLVLRAKEDLELQSLELVAANEDLIQKEGELLASNEELEATNMDLERRIEENSSITNYHASMITSLRAQDLILELPEVWKENLMFLGTPSEEAAAMANELRGALSLSNPVDVGADLLDRAILDPAAEELAATFADQPRLEAPLRIAFGSTYQRLGSREEALAQFERAHELYSSEFGPESREALTTLTRVGSTLRLMSELDRAEAALVQAGEGLRDSVPKEDESYHDIHLSLGLLYRDGGRLEKAEEHLRLAYQGASEFLGEDSELAIKAGYRLGVLLSDRGRFEESEELVRGALGKSVVTLGVEHETSRLCNSGLGVFLLNRGRFEEAAEQLRPALDLERRLSGDFGSNTMAVMGNMASALEKLGETAEAEALLRESLEVTRRARGNQHRDTQRILNNLGSLLQNAKRLEEALPILEEAYAIGADKEHPSTYEIFSRLSYGFCLFQTGDKEAAWEVLEPAAGLFFEVLGSHRNTLACLSVCITVAFEVQDKEALVELTYLPFEVHRDLGLPLPPDQVVALLAHRALALEGLKRREEAREVRAELVEFVAESFPRDATQLAHAKLDYARLLLDLGDAESAEVQLDELEELSEPLGGIPQAQQSKWLEVRRRLDAGSSPTESKKD